MEKDEKTPSNWEDFNSPHHWLLQTVHSLIKCTKWGKQSSRLGRGKSEKLGYCISRDCMSGDMSIMFAWTHT